MNLPGSGGVDLHAHSLKSDGQMAPMQVMNLAATAGLEAVALTDHDTTEGLAEAAAAAAAHNLTFIPGVEISSRCGSRDIHILAWLIDPEHSGLRQGLKRMVDARIRRLEAMLKALVNAGAPVTLEQVWACTEGEVPGRPHVAAALVAAGHATSVQNAFDRWIRQGRPGFVGLERLTAEDAIALVRAAGGVTGLAHPGLGGAGKTLSRLVQLGLAAVECDHPAHSPGQRQQWRQAAARHDLVVTAGSDFHGESERHGQVGSERRTMSTLETLQARRR